MLNDDMSSGDKALWVLQHCRFAQNLPQTPLSTQHPAAPSEDTLKQDIDVGNLREVVEMRDVFNRIQGDLQNIQEVVQLSKDPNFPTFAKAYANAFGSQGIGEVLQTLQRLDVYIQTLSQDPKFAKIIGKMQK